MKYYFKYLLQKQKFWHIPNAANNFEEIITNNMYSKSYKNIAPKTSINAFMTLQTYDKT